MPGTALALALLISRPVILGATPAEPVEIETLQGMADGHARMTVEVVLEGRGPYRFLMDTGSQRTVVSTALSDRLGLSPGPRARVVGMAGAEDVETARVASLSFGSRRLSGLAVPLLEGRHIGADGILGTDSLQDQRVVLDFTRNTIAIGTPAEVGGGGYDIVVRARKRSGRLIMTNADIDGIRVDVVIDTGASSTVGNLALQRAMRNRPHGRGTLTGVTGQSMEAAMGLAGLLTINELRTSNVVIAFADSPAFAELRLDRKPAIFLGMRELRAFNRVAIDFTRSKILFDVDDAGEKLPCRQATRLKCRP